VVVSLAAQRSAFLHVGEASCCKSEASITCANRIELFKDGTSREGLSTYLDGPDCWSIRGRTVIAADVFQLVEVANVSATKRKPNLQC